jgi:hypothetical protein
LYVSTQFRFLISDQLCWLGRGSNQDSSAACAHDADVTNRPGTCSGDTTANNSGDATSNDHRTTDSDHHQGRRRPYADASTEPHSWNGAFDNAATGSDACNSRYTGRADYAGLHDFIRHHSANAAGDQFRQQSELSGYSKRNHSAGSRNGSTDGYKSNERRVPAGNCSDQQHPTVSAGGSHWNADPIPRVRICFYEFVCGVASFRSGRK